MNSMAQRNMLCSGQVIDLEMDIQGSGYIRPDPCIFVGGITNFPPSDIQMTAAASGNTGAQDILHMPEHYDSTVFYRISQYPGFQHHLHHAPNLELGVGTASNFYMPYMTTPSSSMPVTHGSGDQMPTSSSYSVIGAAVDEYGRNFVDNGRSSYKRKNSEGVSGSVRCINAASSSSVASNTRHPDGIASVDAASFPLSQYRGSGGPSVRETGPQRSVRNRLGATGGIDPVLTHCHNQFLQGNYMVQPFQPAVTDGSTPTWSQAPPFSYIPGGNVGVPLENGHRNSASYFQSPLLSLQHRNFHQQAPHMQGVRSHNIHAHPHVAGVPYPMPTGYAPQNPMNPSQDGLEMGLRHPAPMPPTGFRIYRSHREGVMPESTLRHRNLPHLRVLPPDGVALLEFPDYYEVGNFVDHHRDMRLDIEDMSYEELLALEEHIGSVNTGLSEEIIRNKLITRTYSTSATYINLEEAAPIDQEPGSCIICQEDYKNQEKIGTLDCGHEYHADCLKKWLFLKNVCPICKSEALMTDQKDM